MNEFYTLILHEMQLRQQYDLFN